MIFKKTKKSNSRINFNNFFTDEASSQKNYPQQTASEGQTAQAIAPKYFMNIFIIICEIVTKLQTSISFFYDWQQKVYLEKLNHPCPLTSQ